MKSAGVSVVIGAVLLIGAILAVSAVFYREYTFYSWRQAEVSHAASVEGVFFDLKSGLEGITPGRSRGFEMYLAPTPPFLAPNVGDWGELEVIGGDGASSGQIHANLNYVFFSSQRYIYEEGAVILVQPDGEMMLSPPPLLVVVDNGSENIKVFVRRVRIIGSDSASGGGTCSLQVICEEIATESGIRENVEIRISSTHSVAWGCYLRGLYEEFLEKGYNPILNIEDLELIIRGKDPAAADIEYFEENVVVRASIV